MPPRTPARGSTPSVLLEADGDALTVRLAAPPAAGHEVAFYLLRDGERVATRWYSADPVTRFPGPLARGRYEAQAFIRAGADAEVERLRSPALTHPRLDALQAESLASAPPLVLHIGLPKTGTTYLQRTFHRALGELPTAPLEYPEAGFYNHQVALYEPLGAHLPWKPRAGAPALWAGLSRRLGTAGTRRMLLSAEALAGLDPAGIALFRALLGGRPVERIVITTRALAKLLPSHWQQNMKQGGRGTLEAYADRILDAISAERSPAQMFCVAHTVRLWRAEFPDTPVAVLVMDGGQEQNLLAFADLCGLGAEHDAALLRSVPTASEQNLSFSVDECRQLVEINEAIARGQLDVAARKQAIDGFFRAREQGGDYRKPELDPARTQAAHAVDQDSRAALGTWPACQWLRGRDGRQPAGGTAS